MLNFNLKNKIKKIILSHSDKISEADIKIEKQNITITIEIKAEEKIDYAKLELELKEKISNLKKLESVKFIIHQHKKLKKTPKLILICSAKGGVGKSSICVNLAAYAANILNKKIGIVDADIYGPSTDMLLDLEGKEPQLKDGLMQPLENHGVKLMSMGSLMPKDRALVWRAPMITKSLNNLINNSDWGDTEYLFIDMPPGTGDIYISLLKNFTNAKAILISTPHKISLLDVRRSLDMLKKLNTDILGVVENMASNKKHVKNFAKENQLNYLGKIDFSSEIADLSDEQKLFFSEEMFKNDLNDILAKIL